MTQFIKLILLSALFLQVNAIYAQSTYIPINSWEYHLLDRLDIKSTDSGAFTLHSTKPHNRKYVTNYVQNLDSILTNYRYASDYEITPVDRYNINKLLMGNTEWLTKQTKKYDSKKNLINRFYLTKNNFYSTNQPDFFVAINPLIQQTQSVEMGNNKRVYLNSKGVEMRGLVGKKIGFYAMVTDNQENGPTFYAKRVDSLQAVPGSGFYKPFLGPTGNFRGQDYFDYRGYITFAPTKYIDVQYGYDKYFLGNGLNSLFLSDISAPILGMKINTKVWKLNYQNLFMELNPTFTGGTGGAVLERKYAAMHHLSINLAHGTTLGLFEGVIFKRRNKFDLAYLVPVIFYRSVESGLGSGDNAVIGADFKTNFAEHFQAYGQALLDEFRLSNFKTRNWALKYGGQIGLKYIDVAAIKNLDMQLEWNIVRPFTYTHFDSATTYTHYNQPLAHPLGANFSQLALVVKYQPTNKLSFDWRTFYITQGLDSSLRSRSTFGGNIFRQYQDRNKETQVILGQGNRGLTVSTNFTASYELRTNLYFDAGLFYRHFTVNKLKNNNSLLFTAGVRLNMQRRPLDY